ncbi:MAG TPA: dTMP kinase [Actinomycetes bacterium]|nr:dTMP kinase [Actinomycetes bacterium]
MSAVEPAHDLKGLLQIAPFRKLWTALGLASLGDWLGMFATVAMAAALTGDSYAGQNFAVAGVFLIRLAPAVVFGPIAGVVADRLDRRWTMIICQVGRGLLFASIPIVGTLWWLYVATFLVEILAMFWLPAKEATMPNLVPPNRLEAANQLSLVTTYGMAPIAAAIFTLLALLSGALAHGLPFFRTNQVNLALYINAATFFLSALIIAGLHVPRTKMHTESPSMIRTAIEGWKFVGRTPVVRGVTIGMLGAFGAAGAVVGLSSTYTRDLGAGNAAFGVLVGTIFLGMAIGMFAGPRLLAGFSRRRLFGLTILAAGVVLAIVALVGNIIIAVLLTAVLGALSGTAWVSGQTMIGLEVSDELRGRTFAFLQSLVRITLVAVLGLAPLVSGAIGRHHFELTANVAVTYNGAAITLFLAGLGASVFGLIAYHQMDDRRGVPLLADLVAAIRAEPRSARPPNCLFIALEGGEGAGKSTQAKLLGDWLRSAGHHVVVTHEPGATVVGRQLRGLLLDRATGSLSARSEALLYAADRAEHVSTVIVPALERGAIVVTDRYVDSSIAYQGAGRELPIEDVARLSRWATGGLRPDLTVVLDLPPEIGLRRAGQSGLDRLESETFEFHERVRKRYLELAAADPRHYVVINAVASPEEVAAAIRERIESLLPTTATARQPASRRATRADRPVAKVDGNGPPPPDDAEAPSSVDAARTRWLPRLTNRAEERSGAGRHARRAARAARHANAATSTHAAGNAEAAGKTGAVERSDTEELEGLPVVVPDSAQPASLVDDILGGEIR